MDNYTYGINYRDYYAELFYEPEGEFRGEDKYYHYTSLENCIKLLDNQSGEFGIWASNLAYLNDKEEHINGLNLIDAEIEKLLINRDDDLSDWVSSYKEKRVKEYTLANEIYVICFCSERSLLSQWKYYGKDSGVAIEYNLDRCLYSGFIEGSDIYCPNFAYKVVYNNMTKTKIIDEYIKSNISEIYQDSQYDAIEKQRMIHNNLERLYSYAPLFKHDSFSEEKECRLLFRPLHKSPSENAKSLIHYRVSDGRIVPYMKIKIKGREEGKEIEPVIKSLTVGPGRNQDLVFEALKHIVSLKFSGSDNQYELLSRKDYSYVRINGVEIRKASMPFRG